MSETDLKTNEQEYEYDEQLTVNDMKSLLQSLNKNRLNEIRSILKQLNSQQDCIFDSQLYYECFFKLNNLTMRSSPSNDELRLFVQLGFEKLLANMLKYYSQIALQIDFKSSEQPNAVANENASDFNAQADQNERRISIFSHMMFILNQLLFKLVQFNLNFLAEPADGLGYLFEMIKDEKIFNHLYDNDLKILSALINSLKSLSLFYAYNENVKQYWQNSKIASRFVDMAQNLKTFKITRQIYLILAQISDEDTIQSLPEINQVIKSLCSDMNSFCNYFKTSQFIDRIKIELWSKWLYMAEADEAPGAAESSISEYDITFLNGKSLIHVLNDLNRLSIDPILKYRIWEANYAKNSLKYIILNGNEIEKLFALKLFANLCRIEQVVEFACHDTVLKNSIEMLSKNKKIQIEAIRIVSRQINEHVRKQELPVSKYIIGAAFIVGLFLEKFVFQIEKHY